MNSRALIGAASAAAVSILLGGASPRKVNASDSARARDLRSAAHPGSVCEGVPEGLPAMANLKAAWAMKSSTSSNIRLLFASATLACGEPDWRGSPDMETCAEGWRFAVTLPPELQKPGVYNLNEYEVDFAESVVTAGPASGGCGNGKPSCVGSGMGSAGGAKGPDGTLEIYNVTDDCIAGRVLRLELGSSDQPDLTGTFQATACTPASL